MKIINKSIARFFIMRKVLSGLIIFSMIFSVVHFFDMADGEWHKINADNHDSGIGDLNYDYINPSSAMLFDYGPAQFPNTDHVIDTLGWGATHGVIGANDYVYYSTRSGEHLVCYDLTPVLNPKWDKDQADWQNDGKDLSSPIYYPESTKEGNPLYDSNKVIVMRSDANPEPPNQKTEIRFYYANNGVEFLDSPYLLKNDDGNYHLPIVTNKVHLSYLVGLDWDDSNYYIYKININDAEPTAFQDEWANQISFNKNEFAIPSDPNINWMEWEGYIDGQMEKYLILPIEHGLPEVSRLAFLFVQPWADDPIQGQHVFIRDVVPDIEGESINMRQVCMASNGYIYILDYYGDDLEDGRWKCKLWCVNWLPEVDNSPYSYARSWSIEVPYDIWSCGDMCLDNDDNVYFVGQSYNSDYWYLFKVWTITSNAKNPLFGLDFLKIQQMNNELYWPDIVYDSESDTVFIAGDGVFIQVSSTFEAIIAHRIGGFGGNFPSLIVSDVTIFKGHGLIFADSNERLWLVT